MCVINKNQCVCVCVCRCVNVCVCPLHQKPVQSVQMFSHNSPTLHMSVKLVGYKQASTNFGKIILEALKNQDATIHLWKHANTQLILISYTVKTYWTLSKTTQLNTMTERIGNENEWLL